jgi:hypothetical protein
MMATQSEVTAMATGTEENINVDDTPVETNF